MDSTPSVNTSTENQIKKIVNGRRALFVATKNIDYIRITQEITLLKNNATNLDIIASSAKNYFFRLVYVYWKLLINLRKYDVVFVGFSAHWIMPFLWWKFRGATVVTDLFISAYDTAVFDRKLFGENNPLARLAFWVDKRALHKSDRIISDTNAHSDYFAKTFNEARKKFITLYLEADKSIYHPMKIEKPFDLREKFVVMYFGTLMSKKGIQGGEYVLEAASLSREERNIHFIIVGPLNDSQRDKYENLPNLTLFSWLSQDELAKKIAISDLCLAGHFESSIGKAKRVIAGKTYIYLAMNKKIILGDNVANRELFSEETEKIKYTKMGDAEGIKNKVFEEYKKWEEKL